MCYTSGNFSSHSEVFKDAVKTGILENDDHQNNSMLPH
jgi:metal-responsive CopG/Arc/MetJ family transcriptional regulator